LIVYPLLYGVPTRANRGKKSARAIIGKVPKITQISLYSISFLRQYTPVRARNHTSWGGECSPPCPSVQSAPEYRPPNISILLSRKPARLLRLYTISLLLFSRYLLLIKIMTDLRNSLNNFLWMEK